MNCPKCRSNNIRTERRPNGFNRCNECGHQWQSGRRRPEPSTAEKLLWLVENVRGACIFEGDLGNLSMRLNLSRNKFKVFTIDGKVKNRDMLIDKAYEWQRRQEMNNIE